MESKWDSESGSNLHRQIYKVRQSFVKTTKEINSIDKRKTSRENFCTNAKSELKRSGDQARLLTWQVDNQSGAGESLFVCFCEIQMTFLSFSDSLFGFALYLYLYLNSTFELMMVFAEAGGRLETRWWQQAGQGQTQIYEKMM